MQITIIPKLVLRTKDPKLMRNKNVRVWLSEVERIMEPAIHAQVVSCAKYADVFADFLTGDK